MAARGVNVAMIPASPAIWLDGISWETYETLVRESAQGGSHVRITYDQGRMAMMSPLPIHEKWKQLIGRLIEVLAEERAVPLSAYGSTTWKREDLQRGLEPDQCYYVQHAPAMLGKVEIDLRRDPPPDLAVEIEHTYPVLNRLHVYASLGIPEVWRYEGKTVAVLGLVEGDYEARQTSIAFPDFRPDELHRFLAMHPGQFDGEIAAAFRAWLRGE